MRTSIEWTSDRCSLGRVRGGCARGHSKVVVSRAPTATTMADWRAHTNGAHSNGSQSYLQRFDLDTSSRDTSADERSRSRPGQGYGRLGVYGTQSQARVHPPGRLNREHAHRRSRDEPSWSASRSRSRPGGAHDGAHDGTNGQVEGPYPVKSCPGLLSTLCPGYD